MRSSNSARLGSPVSASWKARRRSSSSSATRSVTSRESSTSARISRSWSRFSASVSKARVCAVRAGDGGGEGGLAARLGEQARDRLARMLGALGVEQVGDAGAAGERRAAEEPARRRALPAHGAVGGDQRDDVGHALGDGRAHPLGPRPLGAAGGAQVGGAQPQQEEEPGSQAAAHHPGAALVGGVGRARRGAR